MASQTWTIFQNKNVRVDYDAEPKPCITWYDLNDQYNDFKGFTRNVRGINKAVQFIRKMGSDERLKDDLKMGDITNILDMAKLKPHTYCGMD